MIHTKRLIKSIVAVFFLVMPFSAFSDPKTETFGPNCTYETTQIMKNGVIVETIKVKKCKEETQKGKQKFDPKNNSKHEIIAETYKVGLYSVFIYAMTKMD